MSSILKRILFILLPAIVCIASAHAMTGTTSDPAVRVDEKTSPVAIPELPPAIQTTTNDVFGRWLFNGAFADETFTGFNPNYQISIGDNITLRLWGAYELDKTLTVDAQGNIFVPRVGPVKVLNVRNDKLNVVIKARINRVYKKNVGIYVSLESAQPVKVFVTGFVNQPGLYSGFSSDSVLQYLDRAGGIDIDRGSFLEVKVLRGEALRHVINLYDFLLKGKMALLQLADGDTILVGPRKPTVAVSGLVHNPFLFEFPDSEISLTELMTLSRTRPEATHVRVVRNHGEKRHVDYLPLDRIADVTVYDGDEVEVTSDRKMGTITVRVEGEHDSQQEYVLPYGTTLGRLMGQVTLNNRSNADASTLFRREVKARQKEMLNASLQALEASVLTARSATSDEANLREKEADLILQWVKYAKAIDPRGVVVLADAENANAITLEHGDIINIPAHSSLVMVHGEVLFPGVMVYDRKRDMDDYISMAGGYTQNASASQVIVLRQNGTYEQGKRVRRITSGDEIIILPKVDVKSLQITKEITTLLYQIAIAAAVVVAF